MVENGGYTMLDSATVLTAKEFNANTPEALYILCTTNGDVVRSFNSYIKKGPIYVYFPWGGYRTLLSVGDEEVEFFDGIVFTKGEYQGEPCYLIEDGK